MKKKSLWSILIYILALPLMLLTGGVPRKFGNPTATDVHVDTALSNISIAYKPEGFIADLIFKQVPVDKQSDSYYIWTKGFWLRNMVERRTPGDTYPEGRMELSDTAYYCQPYHLGYAIPDEVRDNADPAVSLEATGAEWLATQFALNREIKVAGIVFANSWETQVTGGTNFVQWDDYDSSNPITDINTGKQTVQKSTGIMPNTLVIGQEVFDVLAEHPLLLDKFRYTQTGILDLAQIQQAMKVQNLIVGSSVYESTVEGASSATRGYIWGKKAILLYIPSSPALMTPAAGYDFVWRQTDGGGLTVPIRNTREDTRDRDFLKGKHAFDAKITATDLGYYLNTCVA